MQADLRFVTKDKRFWANVRSIGETLGYTKAGRVRTYTLEDLQNAMRIAQLDDQHLTTSGGEPTRLADELMTYFEYRAQVLNEYVELRLMDADKAANVFQTHYEQLSPQCPIPMNKQSGEKKAPQYLTGLVNMLIEANSEGEAVNYDPRILTTFTRDHQPLRTFARRVDGCLPSCVNPIAIWEIKEYYYTTTFGSRIADGVYETLLDGLELEELREHERLSAFHLLVIDSRRTWWEMGKSYLCRIIDMLNMGYVDEVLFGYEVVERLPNLVKQWLALLRQR